MLSYFAEEVQEETIEETGVKKVSIEFEFEVLDQFTHELRPHKQFSLIVSDEQYLPTEVKITDVTGWEEEKWLKGTRDGKMKGMLTFEVPSSTEEYGLLLRTKTLGEGILIEFN